MLRCRTAPSTIYYSSIANPIIASSKQGNRIHLTPKEFELLHYLLLHAGEPIPHKRLLNAIWGPQYGSELEYLRTFIRSLRKKIEDDPSNPRYLLTDAYFGVGSSRVDLQACKLEYSIVSPK